MIRFILEIIVFTLIAMLCFSVYGQGWQDEEHIWNEEKGRFEVHNKAHGRVVEEPEEKRGEFKFQPPTEEWAKYLSLTVRKGKRQATEWEIREAQRKLWAKGVMTARAMAKSQQRRQLIAYRKATGWYAARRSGNHSHGMSWTMQMHMRAVGNHLGGGGYNGYY